MNNLQNDLLKVILEVFKIDAIYQSEDLRYAFRNFIRRFALAEDEYLIKKCLSKYY